MAAALAPATAHAAAPSNDDFVGALTLPVGGQVQGNNVDATHETNEAIPSEGALTEPDCASESSGPKCTSSVWYTFTPATTGPYTIETCDLGTDLDTVLAVYHGSFGSLTQDVANDDACAGGPGGNGSRVSFTATGSTTYYVEVAGYQAAQGTFWLRSYAGSSPQAVPEPDTGLQQFNSFARTRTGAGPPIDGPRHSASFAFTSDTDGASFECSLDGAAFTACHSPMSFDGLAGTHTFSVRSVSSGVPDPTPASATFSVDGTPPDTSLTAAPTNPTSDPSPDFTMSSSERNWFDSHQCSIDAEQLQPGCESTTAYSALCNGPHTFTGAAVDFAGNVDSTPVSTTFTETGGTQTCAPPLANVTATPDDPTDESLQISVNMHGDGGTSEVEYGTTPSYGLSFTSNVLPNRTSANTTLSFLTPGTLYHYRVIVTTAQGTVDTGDATFTTQPEGGTPPTVSLGTPIVVGTHAVAFPVSADTGVTTGQAGVLLDTSPIQPSQSPLFASPVTVPGGGPTDASVDVVDLDPGTYHVRGYVIQNSGEAESVLTPEVTFTIAAPGGPPVVVPPVLPPVQPFKLRAGFIRVAKIRHGSKTITLVIRHLPPSTVVNVTVNATVRASAVKRLASGHAKANKAGVAKVKIKLSKKARKLLHSKRTKRLSVKVRAKPPGQVASSVTLHPKLRR